MATPRRPTQPLLRGRNVVRIGPRLGPAITRPLPAPVAITPTPGPAADGPAPPIAPGVITTPITPAMPSVGILDGTLELPPITLRDDALIEWVKPRLQLHNDIRDRSAWYTGMLIDAMMPKKAELDFKNIKELVLRHELPISHMTAQKYVTCARSFREDVVVREGVEKCYSLAVYSKLLVKLGRPAKEARYILSGNDLIEGSVGADGRMIGARAITNSKLREAIRTLRRDALAPTAPRETPRERDRQEKALVAVREHARKVGMVGSRTRLIKKRGTVLVAIYVPVDAALALPGNRPTATLRLVRSLARTDPDFVEDLARAGFARRARV